METKDIAIKISNVKKMYKLGQIGGGTLYGDLQSWWARIRGKEDPNSKIGTDMRSYGKTFMALNGVDIIIKKGEAIGIIGHNGAGKSTLLKLLSRVTAPTEGEIGINGRIASMLEVGTGFNPHMTGRENIYMNGAMLGMTRAEVDAKMEQIIDFSEVREFIDTPVKRYSSGMYVKLAFSVAAHLDSEIIIMDEVLAVGDMAFQKKCLDKMREAATKEGRTVLYVSHNMNTIRRLCDRCIVLDKGKIVFDGDVETGIDMYLNTDNSVSPVSIDLTKAIHNEHTTHKAEMIGFEFANTQAAHYFKNQPIEMILKWKSNQELYGVRFRIQIINQADVYVGTVVSDVICDTIAGGEYSSKFVFDTTLLAEGRYICSVSLIQNDGIVQRIIHDHITRAIAFEIIPDEENQNMVLWDHRYWGSVKFPNMKVVEEI